MKENLHWNPALDDTLNLMILDSGFYDFDDKKPQHKTPRFHLAPWDRNLPLYIRQGRINFGAWIRFRQAGMFLNLPREVHLMVFFHQNIFDAL